MADWYLLYLDRMQPKSVSRILQYNESYIAVK